ncbi:MAG: hypothetical protein HYX60_02950 [Legionella longbeachae]|nr:hypothetical protein [Legionella longbeachae]
MGISFQAKSRLANINLAVKLIKELDDPNNTLADVFQSKKYLKVLRGEGGMFGKDTIRGGLNAIDEINEIFKDVEEKTEKLLYLEEETNSDLKFL